MHLAPLGRARRMRGDGSVPLRGDAPAHALLAGYAGHWVVARGDTVTLPEMGDRFKLTDVILDTVRVAGRPHLSLQGHAGVRRAAR